jgi:hypothetical protein
LELNVFTLNWRDEHCSIESLQYKSATQEKLNSSNVD